MENKNHNLLFIDSGAFSVAHSNKIVDIDMYVDYINTYDDGEMIWAELDIIPFPVLNMTTAKESAEGSWQNYLYMLGKVKCPERVMYVYHFGESKEAFLRALETPVNGRLPEYIGIGGRHGVSIEAHNIYYEKMFGWIENSCNPKVKVHAFGMTVLDTLELFPFWSADSTTYLLQAVYGRIWARVLGGRTEIFQTIEKPERKFENLPKETQDKITEEILERGFTLDCLRHESPKRVLWNMQYFKEWADNYKYRPQVVKKIGLF